MTKQESLNKIICLLQQIQQQTSNNTLDIIQCVCAVISVVLAIIAGVLAWFIPKKIMWEQSYSTLIADYRSYDFAIAVQGIVEFFAVDCKSNVDKIKEEYERRFVRDMYGLDLDKDLNGKFSVEKVKEKLNEKKTAGAEKCIEPNQKSPELCLHYQRRLLAQFYYQLDLCANSHFIRKKRIYRDFTKGETNLVRLLFLMDRAVDGSDVLFKDISCDERVPRKAKGMNHYLCDIYRVLKNSKPYMET